MVAVELQGAGEATASFSSSFCDGSDDNGLAAVIVFAISALFGSGLSVEGASVTGGVSVGGT